MLKTRLVELTAGLVKPSTLIWKGRIRKAPEMPPMEPKKETTKETTSGINGETSTPETGKCIRTPQYAPSIMGRPVFSESQGLK
jgi:hypothetical protein